MFRQKFFVPLLLTFLLLQINHALSQSLEQIRESAHQVSIRTRVEDESVYGSGHICSAALISNFTLLTSASCLLKRDGDGEFYEAGDLKVAMGNVNRLVKDDNTYYAQVIAVKPHGRFNRRTYANNLAILELEKVEFGLTVIPVLTSGDKISGNLDCYVLGWRSQDGELTDTLMRSNVKTTPRDSCNKADNLPFSTFCSMEENSSTIDTCVGEEGSALICNEMLRGIVSKDCRADGAITQYTDVSQLYNWIGLSHLDGSLKMIDSEMLKSFVFSALDLAAYYINTPKIADDFEVLKFIF